MALVTNAAERERVLTHTFDRFLRVHSHPFTARKPIMMRPHPGAVDDVSFDAGSTWGPIRK